MAFLNSVQLPGSGKTTPTQTGVSTPKVGGFLSSVSVPSQEQSQKIGRLQADAAVDADTARRDTSFMGLAKNTILGLGEPIKAAARKVADYAKAGAATVVPFGQAILDPKEGLKKVAKQYTEEVVGGIQKAASGAAAYGKSEGANKLADTANLISGVAQTMFSPITGTFKVASKVPGLKEVADLVSLPFTVTGIAGAFVGGKIVDSLPGVSEEAKETLREPFKELGSLGGQVLLGGRILKGVSEFAKTKTEITPEIAKTIVDNAKSEVAVQPKADVVAREHIDTARETLADVDGAKVVSADPQGFIDATKADIVRALDTYKLPEEAKRVNAIDTKGIKSIEEFNTKVSEVLPPETGNAVKGGFLDTVKTGEPAKGEIVSVRSTKSGSDINTKLAEEGFEAIPQEQISQYRTTTKAEQVQRVSDIITKDLEGAKQMIRGEKEIPNGVLPQVLFNAMEARALKEGDVKTLQDLAKSPIGTQLSEAAQTLGAHGYTDNVNSPVQAIRDIMKVRQIAAEKRVSGGKRQVVKEAAKAAKSVKPKKQTWAEFVREIQC